MIQSRKNNRIQDVHVLDGGHVDDVVEISVLISLNLLDEEELLPLSELFNARTDELSLVDVCSEEEFNRSDFWGEQRVNTPPIRTMTMMRHPTTSATISKIRTVLPESVVTVHKPVSLSTVLSHGSQIPEL